MMTKLLKVSIIVLILHIVFSPFPLLAKKRVSYKKKYLALLKKNLDLKNQKESLKDSLRLIIQENNKFIDEIDSLKKQLSSTQQENHTLRIQVQNLREIMNSNKKRGSTISGLLVSILVILVLVNIVISLVVVTRIRSKDGATRGQNVEMTDLRRILGMSTNLKEFNKNLPKLIELNVKLDEIKGKLDGINNTLQKNIATDNSYVLKSDYYSSLKKSLDNIKTVIRQLSNQINDFNSKINKLLIIQNQKNDVFQSADVKVSNISTKKTDETTRSSSKDYFTSLTEDKKEIFGTNKLRKYVESWGKLSLEERRNIFREMLGLGVYLLDPQLELNDNVVEISNFVQNILTRQFKIDDINRFFKVKPGSDYIKKTIKPAILRRVDNEYILKETGELG